MVTAVNKKRHVELKSDGMLVTLLVHCPVCNAAVTCNHGDATQ